MLAVMSLDPHPLLHTLLWPILWPHTPSYKHQQLQWALCHRNQITLTIFYDISDIQHHGGQNTRVHLVVFPKPRHLDDQAGRNLKNFDLHAPFPIKRICGNGFMVDKFGSKKEIGKKWFKSRSVDERNNLRSHVVSAWHGVYYRVSITRTITVTLIPLSYFNTREWGSICLP